MAASIHIEIAEQAQRWIAENPELIDKLKRALMCGAEEATVGLEEAIKFMHLVAGSQARSLTPSHRVDLVWHEMILFTRSYALFCDEQFGEFIHHQPSSEQAKNASQFGATLHLYAEVFGVPPGDFWGTRDSRSACGTCESAE